MHRTKSRTSSAPSSLQRARLVLPVFLGGVLIALAGLAWREMTPREVAASSVRDEIAAIIELKGYFGPFVMQAESFDPDTGQFMNFHAETDHLMVGARIATLKINAATDTVQFDLSTVTILKIPEDDGETQTISKAEYILGPFDWKRDIVADGE